MTRFSGSALVLALCAGGAAAQQMQTWISYDVTTMVGASLVVRPGEVLSVPGFGLAFSAETDVAAIHRDGDGAVLFALATTTVLPGGLVAKPNDVVRWDGVDFERIFIGDLAVVDLRGKAIDAITRDPLGRLTLSFDTGFGFANFVLHPAGLYAVVPSGPFFSFDPLAVFDPVAAGIAAGVNLDAAHYAIDPPFAGLFLLSFDQTVLAGSVPVRDHEVALATGNSLLGQAVVPGMPIPSGGSGDVDLVALWFGMVGEDDDRIFADGFDGSAPR